MPHSKRQSSTTQKRTTERQIVLARRSRSIKASLLKVLSLDLVALYQADRAQDSPDAPTQAVSQPIPRSFSANLHDRHVPPNIPASEHSVEPPQQQPANSELTESFQQVQEMNHRPADVAFLKTTQNLLGVVVVRCIAFSFGLLIRYVLTLYVQRFAILLSGIAIAISGASILIVVVFTPWKKKLLWNLGCLFGGLLMAVLFS